MAGAAEFVGDRNLSNLLAEINPDLADTFVTTLAHEDDDNIFERKLKHVIEGEILGLAVDAAITEAKAPSRAEPNKDVRMAKAEANNATSVESNYWEPNERAALQPIVSLT